jgi:hypothetical protein
MRMCSVMKSWYVWCEVHLGSIVRLMNVFIAPDVPYLDFRKSCKPYHLQGKTARLIEPAFHGHDEYIDRTTSFGSAVDCCTIRRYCIGLHILTVKLYDGRLGQISQCGWIKKEGKEEMTRRVEVLPEVLPNIIALGKQ